MLAHHQQQARPLRHGVEARVHLELAAHVREQVVEHRHLGQVRRGGEVHAHEEQARRIVAFDIAELLRIDDVAAGLEQQPRDRVDDAGLVAAGQREDEFLFAWHQCTNCAWKAANEVSGGQCMSGIVGSSFAMTLERIATP
jgi:hypothetical protein